MPNGSQHFYEQELPALEAFFSRIETVLTQFGDVHNLKIDRYWHQLPSWRFSFKHPKRGLACIEVIKESDTEIKIYSYWWMDDFEKATRYSCRLETEPFMPDARKLQPLLESILSEILSRPLDAWSEIKSGLEQIWSIYSKEEFLKFEDSYPLPRI